MSASDFQASDPQTANLSSAAPDLDSLWISVLSKLAKEVGAGSCHSWFEKASPLSFERGILTLRTSQRLVRDRLQTQYGDILLSAWKQHIPEVKLIDIVVDASRKSKKTPAPIVFPGRAKKENDAGSANTGTASALSTESWEKGEADNEESDEDQEVEETRNRLDPRLTFETFIVGKPNEFAYAAAQRAAEASTPQFNPLFLYGGVGLGKTHLMHAIAWKIQEHHPDHRVIYLSAERFMYQFIRSLRFHDSMRFKERFRSVDTLMIDDFQFIGGKETTQEEFFHTFNALIDNSKQIIISADKSPSDLENIGDRLKSRLGWGLVADIHPTTYELRLGILQSKVERLPVKVSKDVMEFLAAKITSNVRELEGALNRLVAHASLVGRPITLESTQEVLGDLLRANERYLTIEDIQKRTSEFFGVKLSEILSAKRSQNLTRPRQVAMYLCKVLTTKSLPEIGRKFGGRDHTTVLHAIRKVQELCETNVEFAHDLETLQASLR